MNKIVLKKICKSIKGTIILNNISLEFESGKIYGLKGKNGCGKTMLMRIICGLVYPTSGEVIFDDMVLHKDINRPLSLGALIENPTFLDNYSGINNLRLLAGLDENVKDEDINKAIECVNLGEEKNKKYKKYSLGMKQKLGIANAIMGEPNVIVLDEPINALDEESVKKIRIELKRLRDLGKIIIIACHDKEELMFLSDYVYEINEGRCLGGYEVIDAN